MEAHEERLFFNKKGDVKNGGRRRTLNGARLRIVMEQKLRHFANCFDDKVFLLEDVCLNLVSGWFNVYYWEKLQIGFSVLEIFVRLR